jgi:hypothetical protein
MMLCVLRDAPAALLRMRGIDWMALRKILILRSLRSGRLEGRTADLQQTLLA